MTTPEIVRLLLTGQRAVVELSDENCRRALLHLVQELRKQQK